MSGESRINGDKDENGGGAGLPLTTSKCDTGRPPSHSESTSSRSTPSLKKDRVNLTYTKQNLN